MLNESCIYNWGRQSYVLYLILALESTVESTKQSESKTHERTVDSSIRQNQALDSTLHCFKILVDVILMDLELYWNETMQTTASACGSPGKGNVTLYLKARQSVTSAKSKIRSIPRFLLLKIEAFSYETPLINATKRSSN